MTSPTHPVPNDPHCVYESDPLTAVSDSRGRIHFQVCLYVAHNDERYRLYAAGRGVDSYNHKKLENLSQGDPASQAVMKELFRVYVDLMPFAAAHGTALQLCHLMRNSLGTALRLSTKRLYTLILC